MPFLVPLTPDVNAVIVVRRGRSHTQFKWENLTPRRDAVLEIAADGEFKHLVRSIGASGRGEVSNVRLPAGKYYWRVRLGDWTSSEARTLEIRHGKEGLTEEAALPAPELDERGPLTWKPMAGVSKYEYQIFDERRELKEQGTLTETEALAKLDPGTYRFRVRAIGEKDLPGIWSKFRKVEFAPQAAPAPAVVAAPVVAAAPAPAVVAAPAVPASEEEKGGEHFRRNGFVSFSSLLAPLTYEVQDPSRSLVGSTDARSFVLRLSGEYWVGERIGVSAGIEDAFFTFDGGNTDRKAGELLLKSRVSVAGDWFFYPKAGIEAREYFLMVPGPVAADGSFDLSFDKTLALGASVGFDLRHQFSETLSLGVKAAYFHPLSISGAGAQGLTADASRRNYNLGIQALYWFSRTWGAGAGAYVEKRSISYLTTSSGGAPEQIFMDGAYFFGSLLYTFGE